MEKYADILQGMLHGRQHPLCSKFGFIWNIASSKLSLDTSGSISAGQFEDFVHGYHVEVAFD